MKRPGNANDVRPERQPLWGHLPVHPMLCHLSDAYLAGMGEKKVSPASGLFQRTVMKFAALWIPIEWPKRVAARPKMDQAVGGMRPGAFEEDRRKLAVAVRRFCTSNRDFRWATHPLVCVISDSEWLRWGYSHADQHFRQFGC